MRSRVRDEADLLRLRAELIALRADAVLKEQGVAAQAPGRARAAVAPGAGEPAHRGAEAVPLLILTLATAYEPRAACGDMNCTAMWLSASYSALVSDSFSTPPL